MFYLNGTASDEMNGKTVTITSYKENMKDIFNIDSTIIKDGKFHFEGEEYLNGATQLSVSDQDWGWTDIILERGNIRSDISSRIKVSGTPLNNVYQNFTDSIFSLQAVKNLIIENKDNIAGKLIFARATSTFPTSDFEDVCSKVSEDFKNSPMIAPVIKEKIEYDNQRKKKRESIGTKYQDVKLLTSDNKLVQLSDYVGKYEYIYLDFWSSWCSPCIAEMPHLKEVYEKYKDKGLLVIGISIDEKRPNWIAAMKKYNMPWIHLLIPENKIREVMNTYHVSTIPDGLLLDEDGTILNVKMDAGALDKFMENI